MPPILPKYPMTDFRPTFSRDFGILAADPTESMVFDFGSYLFADLDGCFVRDDEEANLFPQPGYDLSGSLERVKGLNRTL